MRHMAISNGNQEKDGPLQGTGTGNGGGPQFDLRNCWRKGIKNAFVGPWAVLFISNNYTVLFNSNEHEEDLTAYNIQDVNA